MKRVVRIGMDTSKRVFQLHGVNEEEAHTLTRKLRRSQIVDLFSNLEPCVIGIEASGAAHHWARTLSAIGHEVKTWRRNSQALCEAR